MVDVPLDSYLVTVTAVDQSREGREITTATFRAVAQNGTTSESLNMYEKDTHKAIPHALSVDPHDKTTDWWLIKAENVYGTPIFETAYSLDVTADQNLRFVITPKGTASRK